MKKLIRKLWAAPRTWFVLLPLLGLLAAGCQATKEDIKFTHVPEDGEFADGASSEDVGRFAVGDLIRITFSGASFEIPPHEESIKEDGTITLPLIGSVQAAGKTQGELQRNIEDRYVPDYYRRLTATIISDQRVYFVSGQVRQPGRQVYIGATTVLKAITSAGGFTDFADRKRVVLTRADGRRQVVDCNRAARDAAQDPAVFPGDRIEVEMRGLPFGGGN
jgi:protein involved in polysaccharide export with SLBB domain